jgi:hypothetical protein
LSALPDGETSIGYLLAHRSVISSLCLLPTSQSRTILFSAGWDHRLVAWDLPSLSPIAEHILASAANIAAPVPAEKEAAAGDDGKNDTEGGDEEGEGEDEEKYKESAYANYPFKLAATRTTGGTGVAHLASILKEDKKVLMFSLLCNSLSGTSTASTLRDAIDQVGYCENGPEGELSKVGELSIDALPLDLIFLTENSFALLLPTPHILQIYSINQVHGTVTFEATTSAVVNHSLLETIARETGK